MGTYRKPDQYYIDRYDKSTIQDLKRLEQELKKAKKGSTEHHSARIRYRDRAILSYRYRDHTIQKRISEDEKKDGIVAQTSVPGNIKCNMCGAHMSYTTHYFLQDETTILFVYDCPKKHLCGACRSFPDLGGSGPGTSPTKRQLADAPVSTAIAERSSGISN